MDVNYEHNLRYKDYIGKYVKIKTIDCREYEGWLKCIDPMTGNLQLITFNASFTDVMDSILILGDAYSNVEMLKGTDDSLKKLIEVFYRRDSLDYSENVSNRKDRLVSWIKKHRLPVSENEDESLVVCQSVTVCPPYQVENCSSRNARFLKNIQELVYNLPNHFDKDSDTCTIKDR